MRTCTRGNYEGAPIRNCQAGAPDGGERVASPRVVELPHKFCHADRCSLRAILLSLAANMLPRFSSLLLRATLRFRVNRSCLSSLAPRGLRMKTEERA